MECNPAEPLHQRPSTSQAKAEVVLRRMYPRSSRCIHTRRKRMLPRFILVASLWIGLMLAVNVVTEGQGSAFYLSPCFPSLDDAVISAFSKDLLRSSVILPKEDLVLPHNPANYSRILLGITVLDGYDNLAAMLASMSCHLSLPSIIVVDDASSKMIPKSFAQRYQNLTVLRKPEQRGLTHSWNLLWRQFKADNRYDVLIIANDDILVTSSSVSMLASALVAPATKDNYLGERYRFFSVGVMSSKQGAGKSWRISDLQRVATSPFFAPLANASLVDEYASNPQYYATVTELQAARALRGLEKDAPFAVAIEVPGFNGFFFGLNRDAEMLELIDGVLFDPATVNVDNEDRLHRRAQAKGMRTGLCLSCYVFHSKSATIRGLAEREDIYGVWWRPNISKPSVPKQPILRDFPLLDGTVKTPGDVLRNVYVIIYASLHQVDDIPMAFKYYIRCLGVAPKNLVLSLQLAESDSADAKARLLLKMTTLCAAWGVAISDHVVSTVIAIQHEFSILRREQWLLHTKASYILHFGKQPLEKVVLSLNVAGVDAVQDAQGSVFLQRATTFVDLQSNTVGARESCKQVVGEPECAFLHSAPPIVAKFIPKIVSARVLRHSLKCPV